MCGRRSLRRRTFSIFGRYFYAHHLDTDKKTITVPWNYAAKLEEINKIIVEVTGDETKKKTVASYLQDNWDICMKDTDRHLVVADKPFKKK